jgi:hypothetical protein
MQFIPMLFGLLIVNGGEVFKLLGFADDVAM